MSRRSSESVDGCDSHSQSERPLAWRLFVEQTGKHATPRASRMTNRMREKWCQALWAATYRTATDARKRPGNAEPVSSLWSTPDTAGAPRSQGLTKLTTMLTIKFFATKTHLIATLTRVHLTDLLAMALVSAYLSPTRSVVNKAAESTPQISNEPISARTYTVLWWSQR